MFDAKVIALFFNILVCFGIPIASFVYFAKKKKCMKIYIVGMLVFFVSQILLRIPIINNILPLSDSYSMFMATNPIVYMLFLSFTAGLFEETGRFIGFKCIKNKKLSFTDAIAFGFGHGGIEAMMLVGVTGINNLLLYWFSKGVIAGESFLGFTKEMAISTFEEIGVGFILTAGIERIFAITFHIVASIIVLYAVRSSKKIYVFLAMLIHTVFNFIAVILMSMLGVFYAELSLFIAAIILVFVGKYFKKKFDDLEVESYEKIN